MDIIDSHAHLFFDDFTDDYEEMLQRAREVGVKRILNVGLENETNLKVLATHEQKGGLHPTVGWHPHEAEKLTPEDLPELLRLAQLPQVVALGEIGLDYHWGADYIETQKRVLIQLLELAVLIKKPIIIHCREAWDDFFDILRPFRASLGPILLHCYSGGLPETSRALDLDCYFSYAGVITFAKAQELLKTIPLVPRERLLVETDAPYLAPVPRRGKRNEPSLLTHHLKALSKILTVSPEEAADITTQNAVRLFNLTGQEL
ncbi:MAG: TatD family hydrolase [Deltaproteobacteria bacterium]|jgi:TatD DNase family protein|nr:TatD family hydrolase [Deltaproteobacteria bacterium]